MRVRNEVVRLKYVNSVAGRVDEREKYLREIVSSIDLSIDLSITLSIYRYRYISIYLYIYLTLIVLIILISIIILITTSARHRHRRAEGEQAAREVHEEVRFDNLGKELVTRRIKTQVCTLAVNDER